MAMQKDQAEYLLKFRSELDDAGIKEFDKQLKKIHGMDLPQLKAAAQGAFDSMEKGAAKAAKSTGGLSTSLTNLYAKLAAAVLAWKGIYDATVNQAKAEMQLRTAISNNTTEYDRSGKSVRQMVAGYKDFAKERERLTGITEQETLQLITQLTQYRIMPDQIKRITELTQNMSAATGKSADSIAGLFNKIINSPLEAVDSLKEYGIVLTKQMTNTMSLQQIQAYAMTELEKRFKDQAEVLNQSTYGIQGLKNSMESLAGSVGKIVIPSFSGIVTVIREIFDFLGRLPQAAQAVLVVLAGIGIAFTGPLGLISGVALALGGVINLFKSSGDSVKELKKESESLSEELTNLQRKMVTDKSLKTEKLMAELKAAKQGTQEYVNIINELLRINPELVNANIRTASSYDDLRNARNRMTGETGAAQRIQARQIYDQISENVKRFLREYSELQRDLINLQDRGITSGREYDDIQDKISVATRKIRDGIVEMGRAARLADMDLEQVKQTVRELRAGSLSWFDPFGLFRGLGDRLRSTISNIFRTESPEALIERGARVAQQRPAAAPTTTARQRLTETRDLTAALDEEYKLRLAWAKEYDKERLELERRHIKEKEELNKKAFESEASKQQAFSNQTARHDKENSDLALKYYEKNNIATRQMHIERLAALGMEKEAEIAKVKAEYADKEKQINEMTFIDRQEKEKTLATWKEITALKIAKIEREAQFKTLDTIRGYYDDFMSSLKGKMSGLFTRLAKDLNAPWLGFIGFGIDAIGGLFDLFVDEGTEATKTVAEEFSERMSAGMSDLNKELKYLEVGGKLDAENLQREINEFYKKFKLPALSKEQIEKLMGIPNIRDELANLATYFKQHEAVIVTGMIPIQIEQQLEKMAGYLGISRKQLLEIMKVFGYTAEGAGEFLDCLVNINEKYTQIETIASQLPKHLADALALLEHQEKMGMFSGRENELLAQKQILYQQIIDYLKEVGTSQEIIWAWEEKIYELTKGVNEETAQTANNYAAAQQARADSYAADAKAALETAQRNLALLEHKAAMGELDAESAAYLEQELALYDALLIAMQNAGVQENEIWATQEKRYAVQQKLGKIDPSLAAAKYRLAEIEHLTRIGQLQEDDAALILEQIDLYDAMIEILTAQNAAEEDIWKLQEDKYQLQLRLNKAKEEEYNLGKSILGIDQKYLSNKDLQALINQYEALKHKLESGALRAGTYETTSLLEDQLSRIKAQLLNLGAQGAELYGVEDEITKYLKDLFGEKLFASFSGTGVPVALPEFDLSKMLVMPALQAGAPTYQTTYGPTTTTTTSTVLNIDGMQIPMTGDIGKLATLLIQEIIRKYGKGFLGGL